MRIVKVYLLAAKGQGGFLATLGDQSGSQKNNNSKVAEQLY